MVQIPLPEEAIEALGKGKKVKVTHADLPPAGRNGSIYLTPEGYEEHELSATVEVEENPLPTCCIDDCEADVYSTGRGRTTRCEEGHTNNRDV